MRLYTTVSAATNRSCRELHGHYWHRDREEPLPINHRRVGHPRTGISCIANRVRRVFFLWSRWQGKSSSLEIEPRCESKRQTSLLIIDRAICGGSGRRVQGEPELWISSRRCACLPGLVGLWFTPGRISREPASASEVLATITDCSDRKRNEGTHTQENVEQTKVVGRTRNEGRSSGGRRHGRSRSR
jgi:hypothetical protein